MASSTQDIAAITGVIMDYYDGMALNVESKLRQAFHPDCFVIGNTMGDVEWATLDAFIAVVKEEVPDDASRADANYHIDINSIDITNDAAVAKVTNKFVGEWYTDYLSLMKQGNQWVIINKLFHHYADHGRENATS